ncbi:PA0069 family radical SAM protein [Arenibaculum pallidiluteum]|uniref:PA0069 family radical SAM protein n=1 Tax=Arenibaculum pallidiluteum TaxID=2812559 RepID=UPI001A967C36|nr:PA0069 family radical SAM protein [Arenibaculum pallidiluteum]
MVDEIPDRARKGRGAVSNRTGRFEAEARVTVDDGWGSSVEPDPDLPPLRTVLGVDSARSVIARNDSPDIPFDQSVNPYRGCEHGCIYCFARPTHAYLGLSPGLDFETRLFHKPKAPELLDRELRAPGYRCKPLALGANTDPYQPVERGQRLTRRILEVLSAFNQPVVIITKSALVARDLDLLAPMAERRLVRVCLSLTTLDAGLARRLEPRAATPARRLETLRLLSEAGIPTAVLASPMIPGLTDHEMERILEVAAGAGVTAASYILLRLPREIAELFQEWLRTHAPDRAERVLSLLRQTRGGALYRSEFGSRMRGEGPVAALLARRFELACARLGLNQRRFEGLDCTRFRPPPRPGDQFALL